MCDVVTDLDPRAEHVYRFAGMILPWEAGQASAGIRLLEKGLKQFPDSWLMYYWVGFNYYFFENDLAKAAQYLRRAAQLPDAHPNAARLAALLSAEHYGPETTLHFLAELKNEVDSKEMREVVDENIRQAQLARDLERLNGAVREYRARIGSAPATLVALVDARLIDGLPSEPFGGAYELDAESGEVKSSTGHTPSKLHRSNLREKVRQAGHDS
jgi:tetratricopeptide (TPR) repeat protein